MQITKVKNRGVLFTHSNPGWDLNVYLIMGKKYNYIIDTEFYELQRGDLIEKSSNFISKV